MKISLDNFTESLLPKGQHEPYVLLHSIRELIKRAESLQSKIKAKEEERKASEGDEQAENSEISELSKEAAAVNQDINQALKNLVESTHYDTSTIMLNQVKDIFNWVAVQLDQWRSLEKADFARRQMETDGKEPQEVLVVYLQALMMISWQQMQLFKDQIDNIDVLLEIIKESEDIRCITAAFKVIYNIQRNQRPPIEICENLVHLSIAQNLLRSPENHFTLSEISNGVNKKGESLREGNLIIEIERAALGFNDRSQQHIISIPREKVLDSDKTFAQVTDQIINENAQAFGNDQQKLKIYRAKIEAKVKWIRCLEIPAIKSKPLLAVLPAIKVATFFKSSLHSEYVDYTKNKINLEAKEYLERSTDKQTSCHCTHMLCVLFRDQMEQGKDTDPLLEVPASSPSAAGGDQQEEKASFMLKALQDISSIQLAEGNLDKKTVQTTMIDKELVKSSYYQWCILKLLRQSLASINNRQQVLSNEGTQIAAVTLKIIEPPFEEGQPFKFNIKVAIEACSILKSVLKPRLEEQLDIVQKYENRLKFEIKNLQNQLLSSPDGEDFSCEQDPADQQLLIKNLIQSLFEMTLRDNNHNITRRIMESQILNLVLELIPYNIPDKFHIIEKILPQFFLLVGQICNNTPGATSQLIRNGIIVSLFEAVKSHLPESQEAYNLFFFLLSHVMIHDEGRKLALETGVFQAALLQYAENPKFYDRSASEINNEGHVRQQFKSIVDREPAFKDIIRQVLDGLLTRGIQEGIENRNNYYSLVRAHKGKPIVEASKQILSEINGDIKTKFINQLNKIWNQIISSQDEQDRHGGENNSRWLQGILTEDFFKKYLKYLDVLSQNASLLDACDKLSKTMKPLLEGRNFKKNVDLFIEQFEAKILDFKLTCCNGSLSKVQDIDLEFKNEFQLSQTEVCNENAGKLHSILVYAYIFSKMHSDTISTNIAKPNVQKLVKDIFDLMIALKKIRIKVKMHRYHAFTHAVQSDEKNEEKRKKLLITQKEYESLSKQLAEERDEIIKKELTYGSEDMIQEHMIVFNKTTMCLTEFLTKMNTVMYMQRAQRDNREESEKVIAFIGTLSAQLTLPLSNELTGSYQIDNSFESLIQSCYYYNIIDEMYALGTKGCFSGIAFYEFYRLGGLHSVLEFYQKLASLLQQIDDRNLLRTNCMLVDQIVKKLVNFIIRFILEEDKTMRGLDSRYSEVCLQMIFNYKMNDKFDSSKHFYQNVCHTLLSMILPVAIDKNPLHFKSKIGGMKLQDLAISLLSNASKNFQSCFTLKIAFGGANMQRMEEFRDRPYIGRGGYMGDGRGQPPPPNPANVQNILNMGLGYSQQQIVRALQQNRDDINRAVEYLFTQIPEIDDDLINLNAFIEPNVSSSKESKDGISDKDKEAFIQASIQTLEETQLSKVPKQASREDKARKVPEATTLDNLKATIKQGFKWIIQAYDELADIDSQQIQGVLLDIMKNQKKSSDPSNEKQIVVEMRQMYSQIDEIFKRKLMPKLNDDLEQLQKLVTLQEQSEGVVQESIQEEEKEREITRVIHQIQKVSSYLWFNQRLLLISRGYFKEALQSDITIYCFRAINTLLEAYDNPRYLKVLSDHKHRAGISYQTLIHSFLYLIYTVIHRVQAEITDNTHKLNSQGKLQIKNKEIKTKEEFKAIIDAKYDAKVNSLQVFNLTLKLMDHVIKGNFKNQILITSLATALRLLLEKNIANENYRQEGIIQLFTKMSEVLASGEKGKGIEHSLINTISIIFFENDIVVQSQIEKYINSVLFTKYEYTIGQNPSSKDPAHTLSKVSLPQFLQFFSRLSSKNQKAFKAQLEQQCDIKTYQKKQELKLQADKSQIMFKESVFNEVKKSITKDRATFKHAQKVMQISNDKQLKTQIQNSKKALLQWIPEKSRASFIDFLKSLISQTQPLIEAFNGFITAQQSQTPYIVEKLPEISQNNSSQQILEMLSKLCQAYPAYSVLFMQDKQDAGQPSFFSWYIKDFLISQMLSKTSRINESDEEEKKETFELQFQLKPIEALVLLRDHVIRFTNRLTAFNHSMTLNEQLVKHQLRSKLIIEALTILQKVLKEKGVNKGSLKQKCLILASLSVIEALINSQNLAVKTLRLGSDNFVNSLRYCFVRDPASTNKESAAKKDLPQSLLKCLDELLSEYLDVSLPQNSDIVMKSISILKIMADYVATEKKKQEDSLISHRNLQDSREEAKGGSPRLSPRAVHLHDEAMSEESNSLDSVEMPLDQQAHPQPMLIEDDGDEDDEDEDEEEDEENADQIAGHFIQDHGEEEDNEEEPLEELEMIEPEDDYDQEDDNDDDAEENMDMGWGMAHRPAAANPANDIIMFNPDAGNERRHPWQPIMHHYGGARPRAANANQGIDWSQEEIEVQRILGNLGNNRQHPENPRRAHPINVLERELGLAARYGQRPPNEPRNDQEQLEATLLKKGLIDATFEELKLMTDFELSKMVNSQQISLDKEMSAAISLPAQLQGLGINPNAQRLDRERHLLDELRRVRRLVDEVDEEDMNPFRAMRFEMQLGDQDFLLNHILQRDPPMFMGGNHYGIPGFHDHYRRGNQPGAVAEDDQNLFLNSSSQVLQGGQQLQLVQINNNSLAEQLLSGHNVQIEEEQVQPVSAPVNPPIGGARRSSIAGNNNPLADPHIFDFLNPAGQDFLGGQAQPLPAGDQLRLNEMINQMANIMDNVRQPGEIQAIPIQQPEAVQQEQVSQPVQPSEPVPVDQQPSNPVQPVAVPMEDVNAQSEFVEQQQPVVQPIVAQEPQIAQEQPMEQVAHEEVKQEAQEEEKKQEQPAQAQQDPPGTTFGYDNELLISLGLEPEILHELPEEVRNELFASFDLPPPNRAQQQQQPPVQQQPGSEQNNRGAQPQPAQQPAQAQQPLYAQLAQELGLDAEFLANIPEDMRMELIQQRQREIQQPPRQAEQMDIATFIATVTDRNLRREIFMNMDEATLASLPPPLMAEGRQVRDYIANDRARREAQMIERERLEAAMGAAGGIFGRGAYRDRREREELEREMQRQGRAPPGERTIEEVVNLRQIALANEATHDDLISSINSQILQDEKIIEVLLMILLGNSKIECDLIPTMLSLIKIQNTNGVPVIRNKIVNAITFLLKSLSAEDDQAVKEFLPKIDLKKKQSVLIMIGCFRLLLKHNKSLMKYILKGLISREESKGTQILRRQLKAMQIKQPSLADSGDQIMTNVENTGQLSELAATQIDTSKTKSKTIPYVPLAPLAEIFTLIKSEFFKQDRSLMKNLTLLIHQILKQFDIARQELEQSTQQISQETISTIAEVLSLQNIDQQMMDDLGDFFFKISKQKKQNFQLISEYCLNKSTGLLNKLNEKLNDFVFHFEDMKHRLVPGSKSLGLDSREMSHVSDKEEEKVPGDLGLGRLMSIPSIPQESKNKASTLKLEVSDERSLKQHLKIYDDSEVLYRIFKLYNLFYDKFSAENEANKDQAMMIQTQSSSPSEALKFVKETYQNEALSLFIPTLTNVLKIVMKVNIEPNETISNLIFCVLTSFYPELFDANKHEIEIKAKEKKEKEEKKDTTKYQIKMKPISLDGYGEKFSLLRNHSYFTNRIEEMSNFCLVNKKIINKMIKTKPNLFTQELDGFIKYMPNLLDFENKRSYFKKEIHKMKRGNDMYGGQVQLFIRRDDILHDAFTQIRDKTANELKGRLHISFTGERGSDAGGLTRDFFIELSREMFNPNYSLFILSSSGSTYLPNPKSYVEVDHLRYFKFIGRILGKALFEECLLECYFVKSFYKIMLGETLKFSDIEDFDKDLYDNMKWCLNNDVECLMTTFVAVTDYFGKEQEVDLIENGKNIPVTNQNKNEYIEKLAYFKMYKEIQKQVDNFLEGFYELIPKDLISIFNYKELELLISGLPNFDIEDLKQNTEYHGYNANSPQVQWLWEVLETFESSDRAEFLQFVTGSSKIPVDGFKGLIGMRGPQKFTIAKNATEQIMSLPSAHTCYNQIDLPEYPSKEILHERLLLAIKETKGFGFA